MKIIYYVLFIITHSTTQVLMTKNNTQIYRLHHNYKNDQQGSCLNYVLRCLIRGPNDYITGITPQVDTFIYQYSKFFILQNKQYDFFIETTSMYDNYPIQTIWNQIHSMDKPLITIAFYRNYGKELFDVYWSLDITSETIKQIINLALKNILEEYNNFENMQLFLFPSNEIQITISVPHFSSTIIEMYFILNFVKNWFNNEYFLILENTGHITQIISFPLQKSIKSNIANPKKNPISTTYLYNMNNSTELNKISEDIYAKLSIDPEHNIIYEEDIYPHCHRTKINVQNLFL